MGRHPGSIINQNLRKGLWSPEEDEKLFNHITQFGVGCWSSVPKLTGLQRGGKSCRLRWINYLRPDLKKGLFTHQEEALILRLHEILGNRWAQMAAHLPGRTDNEIKNFWNSYLKKKLMEQGIDPNTHKPLGQPEPVMHNNKRNSTNKALLQSLQPNKMASTSIETPEYAASTETPEQPFDMKTLYENSYGTQVLKLREKMDLLGYNFNPSDLCQHNQIPHDSSQFETKHKIEFNSTSYLTDFDIEDMAKTIFSENSASTVSSFSFSESKEASKNSSNVNSTLNAGLQTNNMAENFSIFSGDTKHKMKSLYHSNGSSKPNHWEKHHQCSEDYSDYPSILLSEVKEANLDVFYEI